VEGNDRVLIWGTILAFPWSWGKPRKFLLRIASLQTVTCRIWKRISNRSTTTFTSISSQELNSTIDKNRHVFMTSSSQFQTTSKGQTPLGYGIQENIYPLRKQGQWRLKGWVLLWENWRWFDNVSVKTENEWCDICYFCMKPKLLFRLSTQKEREIIEATVQPLIDKLQRAQI
jgi:hypothetical protein